MAGNTGGAGVVPVLARKSAMRRSNALTADLFEDTAPAVRPTDAFDATGFEIGWDHAHYRLVPPVEHLHHGHPVRQGWQAGQAVFGARTLRATLHVRRRLHLRLAAWLGGRAFEGVQVTPQFLSQLDVAVCPITRERLTPGSLSASDAALDRVGPHAGYAAGNLAVMSARAAQAKAEHGWDKALAFAAQIECGRPAAVDGLAAAPWRRLAVLMSFVTPLPHAQAACLPLVVMPPNRLRVLNAVQALQVLLTQHFMRPGARTGIAELAAVVPAGARHEFNVLMLTLQARRLAAGGPTLGLALRQAMEDAWTHPMVNRRWQRLALQLSEADCEQIVQRLCRRGQAAAGWHWLPRAAATDGWALASDGYAGSRPGWLGASADLHKSASAPRAVWERRAHGANHSDALWHREDLQRRDRCCQAARMQQDLCK